MIKNKSNVFLFSKGSPPPPKETFVTMCNFLFIRFMSFISGQASLYQFNKLISLLINREATSSALIPGGTGRF